ncbi:Uu.00g137520.m01.CDS01 [Anthostomella pinea]|uniref:Uu.00g137520.m01.CDS01 n=1 Tax=Anthostomella pinea TaxID=933095 RepID=A0AAI8VPH8_9PEZI|nr:Uu.00g137520.m01.CDS01 [Anthostomella pinea]
MQRVDAFLLTRPDDFKNFRSNVHNILDWGKNERLKSVRQALDVVLEENRKLATIAAKSRPPPSSSSSISSAAPSEPSVSAIDR